MQELTNKLGDLYKGIIPMANSGLLLGQMLFSIAFVSACEVPNLMSKSPSTNACLERWMTVSALFFPSGVGGGNKGIPIQIQQPAAAPRRAARRTTSTRSAAKK